MSISEIRPGINKSHGEPSASFTPAQARNYRDALLALGVDEASAQKHAVMLVDPVARAERCTGPNCRVDREAVKDAVRTVFGGSNSLVIVRRPR